MKYLIAVAVLLSSASSLGDAVCEIPKNCEFISSEFSTGGGDKAMFIMEVDCKAGNSVTKYIATNVSVSGLFGMGRFAVPKKIKFVKKTKDSISCDY